MELSIIIVNYKSERKLKACLESIEASDMSGLDYEVIVIDNASGDGLEFLPNERVRLIRSEKNLGMGGGNNLGLRESRAPYALILNPDTVIKGRAIPVLLDYLKQKEEVGIVGPKLLNPDGSLQYSCSRFPRFFTPILRRTFLGDYFARSRDRFMMLDFDHASTREVDWLMGSALMFPRRRVKENMIFEPRFDERYFMYFEDTDLCRSAWQAGFKVVYLPEVVIIHDHARESAKYPWYKAVFLDRLAQRHISSWLKYFAKWGIRFKNIWQR